MRRSALPVAMTVAVLGAFLPWGAQGRMAPVCGPSWGLVESQNASPGDNTLADVDALSSTDIWAVGSFADDAGVLRTLAEHWDGQAWSVTPSPNASEGDNALYSVEAIGPDDVWAVGSYRDGSDVLQTLAAHWDGEAWTVVPSPNPGGNDNSLWAVAGISSKDVWAVGHEDPYPASPDTLIVHWDGSAWTAVPSPSPGPSDDVLYGVDASAGNDAWAVGYHLATGDQIKSLFLRWDGVVWTEVEDNNAPWGFVPLTVDVISADNAIAVGASGGIPPWQPTGAEVEHWDGASWLLSPTPPGSGPYSLFSSAVARTEKDIWAVGHDTDPETGLIRAQAEHTDSSGGTWTIATTSDVGEAGGQLSGVAAAGTDQIWAVGSYPDPSTGALRTLVENLCPVVLSDDGFRPRSFVAPRGTTIAWRFPLSNQQLHSITDASGMGLFDSGLQGAGYAFVFTFTAAGTYVTLDQGTGDRSRVSVPMGSRPRSGNEQTVFSLSWASEPAPYDHAYDVQIRRPGSQTFEDWRMGVGQPRGTFAPDTGRGTYLFRARLRNTFNGKAAPWSPPLSILVN